MSSLAALTPHRSDTETIRVGVVSFLNTLPLIDGLGALHDVELHCTVPSLLIDQLENGDVDAALCSSIDYQNSRTDVAVLPAGLLGCHGETLTVRLYSSVPLNEVTDVYCDTDSHTSIVLMQILLHRLYNCVPNVVPYDAREHVAENKLLEWPGTMLLIGDKVVTDSPPAVRYPHQLDLGKAWHDMTGLPFVFAMWLTRTEVEPGIVATIAAILDRQRRHNLERIDSMITREAPPRGWPEDLARRYLKEHLEFEWTDRHRDALKLFYALAAEMELINRPRPLRFIGGASVGRDGKAHYGAVHQRAD